MYAGGPLTSLMLENIRMAQQQAIYTNRMYQDAKAEYGKNNFLFFIKPELTKPSSDIKLEAILDIILKQIDAFGLHIHGINLLSADYLKQYNLIEQHYGVIAEIAAHGLQKLTTQAKDRFLELFGIAIDQVKVLGGSEFLTQYPFFNAHSLDCLWQNTENLKLASGTYVEKLRIDLETVYMLNGFNPRQLDHFTEKGRSIVVMNLSGNLSWSDARCRFIGATNPHKAEKGSLRREFLEQKQALGLSEVSQSYNGVHLSAGPLEALVELMRFESDFSTSTGEMSYNAFSFGRQLTEAFGCIPETIVHNAVVQVDGKAVSVFDLTEEKDSEEAIRLLKHACG